MASDYGYSRLDVRAQETRLPTLPPGPPETAIRIKVGVVVLTEYAVPQSEAVSYTWGFTESTRISFTRRGNGPRLTREWVPKASRARGVELQDFWLK